MKTNSRFAKSLPKFFHEKINRVNAECPDPARKTIPQAIKLSKNFHHRKSIFSLNFYSNFSLQSLLFFRRFLRFHKVLLKIYNFKVGLQTHFGNPGWKKSWSKLFSGEQWQGGENKRRMEGKPPGKLGKVKIIGVLYDKNNRYIRSAPSLTGRRGIFTASDQRRRRSGASAD